MSYTAYSRGIPLNYGSICSFWRVSYCQMVFKVWEEKVAQIFVEVISYWRGYDLCFQTIDVQDCCSNAMNIDQILSM